MPEEVKPRPALAEFAVFMEETLRKHDDEKGERGWVTDSSCSVASLLDALQVEVNELKDAYRECDPGRVEAECADVANFAMMIADRLRCRGTRT